MMTQSHTPPRRGGVAAFGRLVVVTLCVTTWIFSSAVAAEEGGDGWRQADPTAMIATIPVDLLPAWQGGPMAVPLGDKPCQAGSLPVVVGTTDATGRWGHQDQLALDRKRATMMLAPGSSGKWARAAVTQLRGRAAVWCVPEPEGVKDTPPATTARLAITTDPAERVEVVVDHSGTRSTHTARAVWVEVGAVGSVDPIGLWAMVAASLAVPLPPGDSEFYVGGSVGLSPTTGLAWGASLGFRWWATEPTDPHWGFALAGEGGAVVDHGNASLTRHFTAGIGPAVRLRIGKIFFLDAKGKLGLTVEAPRAPGKAPGLSLGWTAEVGAGVRF